MQNVSQDLMLDPEGVIFLLSYGKPFYTLTALGCDWQKTNQDPSLCSRFVSNVRGYVADGYEQRPQFLVLGEIDQECLM